MSANCNTNWLVKLSGIHTRRAKLREIFPIRVEDGDALVTSIGNIHTSLRIDGNAARAPEETLRFGNIWRWLSILSPHLDRCAIRAKLLDAMIPRIAHIYRAVWSHRHTPRFI